MLHASAAFKGGDIQNFWERGRTLYEETEHFMGGPENPFETMLLFRPILETMVLPSQIKIANHFPSLGKKV